MRSIRPFGPIRWLLDKLPEAWRWSVLGTVATEDRCLAAAEAVFSMNRSSDVTLLKISDPINSTNQLHKEVAIRLDELDTHARGIFGNSLEVHQMELLCLEQEIGDFASDFLSRCQENVVVDLSSMPKRYFFPILTLLSRSSRIKNLVATYSKPERYGRVLAEDPQEWEPLPMYGGDPLASDQKVTLMIGVGYQPLKLSEILSHTRFGPDRVKLLLPFPSIPPGFVDNWKFIARIKNEWKQLRVDELPPDAVIRVPTHDVSIVFEQLLANTMNGYSPSIVLAPYGPKTISLAMCMLGIARHQVDIETEIGYTQPRIYHPEYSSGIETQNGVSAVTAYPLRFNCMDLYALPPNA